MPNRNTLPAPITIDNLPPVNTDRWVARRKAQVVAGVEAGLLTVDEACRRYQLSAEEFAAWRKALIRYGVRGLQVTGKRISTIAGGETNRRWARVRSPRWAGYA